MCSRGSRKYIFLQMALPSQRQQSSPQCAQPDSEDHSEMLERYVKRYTTSWPTRSKTTTARNSNEPDVFFVTGTTGTLGSQILANLIARPDSQVGRIYAFNRKHPKLSFRERHEAIFMEKGNDVGLLRSPKVMFVEGDSSVKGFGIAKGLYEEMKNSVTIIIHNAWPVKFTKPLVEFEPNLQGLRNLIDFALHSPHKRPPRLIFMSSIGMVKSWAEIPSIAEAPMINAALVSKDGYPRSKWVAERMLTIARQETDLEPLIVRVGQLSGAANGSWSENEWFPAVVSASRVIGCLPDCGDSVVGFVPLHIGANAIINLGNTSLDFAHVVHPRPITSTKLMQLVSESLGLKVVSTDEWLAKLRSWRKSATAGATTSHTTRKKKQHHHHPAFKLVDFFEGHLNPKTQRERNRRPGQMYQITGMAMLETEKTCESIPGDFDVKMLPPLDRSEIERWIGYWRCCWGSSEGDKPSVTRAVARL